MMPTMVFDRNRSRLTIGEVAGFLNDFFSDLRAEA